MKDWLSGGENSIYSTARFLQWWAWRPKTLDEIYPEWMHYECKIDRPELKTKQLIEQGYIGLCDKNETLPKLLVDELKEILKEHKMPFKGKKQELVDSIRNNLNVEDLELPRTFYSITDKGKAYLDKYAEVLIAEDFRVRYNISLNDYLEAKEQLSPECAPDDILFNIFTQKMRAHSASNSFGLLRCVIYDIAKKYEADGNYAESVKHFCAALRYDLSGLDNSNSFTFSNIFIAPALASTISKYKNYIDDSTMDFCRDLYLPRSMTDFETFKRIINDILNEHLLPVENYITTEKRVYEEYETDDLWSKSVEELEAENAQKLNHIKEFKGGL